MLETLSCGKVVCTKLPRLHRCILEVRIDKGNSGLLELFVGDVELLFRELSHLREEQTYEDVAFADLLVVFVLQTGRRHRVEEVLPPIDLDIPAAGTELIV